MNRRLFLPVLGCVCGVVGGLSAAGGPAESSVQPSSSSRLDPELQRHAHANPDAITSVIVTLAPGAEVPGPFRRFARANGHLAIINAHIVDLPNGRLRELDAHTDVVHVHHNRPIGAFNYRTSITTGARTAHERFAGSGAGIGIAVIDSGITAWHNDLTSRAAALYPYGNQRVSAFVDFVNGQQLPYDDHGHGTHVAGIIAGNGYDSDGRQAGIAPAATLLSLKVLDGSGAGTIGHLVAAFDWLLLNHARYDIRIINVSVGAEVLESYWTDPVTLAAKKLVEAGVVVVAAAGNGGRGPDGTAQYGGITAPGNAPWVLTVGASSTNGTLTREDDQVAAFSSRGPTYINLAAKPDLVAPGVGTVSLASQASRRYAALPYLSLTGTSMAAPAVSATVALMLEANPRLTPNAVKGILEYTAERYPNYDALTQGAGFLNALGAVELSAYFAQSGSSHSYPRDRTWARHILWGNNRVIGGLLLPWTNAWAPTTIWGAGETDQEEPIVWGARCARPCGDLVTGWDTGDNVVWGTGHGGDDATGRDGGENVVWGTGCGGADCDNVVWGTGSDRDNVVWGTDVEIDVIWPGDAGASPEPEVR